ncbi:hypothetical protein GW17_00044012 [Ensete ventricosum]|nr:hypothetical protein GW17_00044012 [Ensete ventricosum]
MKTGSLSAEKVEGVSRSSPPKIRSLPVGYSRDIYEVEGGHTKMFNRSDTFSRPTGMALRGDFSQDIPSDIVVQVGDATFQLHKFVLAAKSGYIRRKVMESESANLSCIDLSDVPIGAEVFERVAKFCYGVNFEISLRNVAALRCAAEYLQMTEEYCRGNLAARTEEFINQAAVKTLPGAVALLRSCEGPLLPMAESLQVVQLSVDAISLKVLMLVD